MTRHYPRAPIVEAIIDMHAEVPSLVQDVALAAMQGDRSDEYPARKNLWQGEARFEISDDTASSSANRQLIGYQCESADKSRVFQVRRNGFALSRLAPYGSWEPFRDEARSLWQDFRTRFSPPTITRLAVRYINRIELNLPRVELSDYFKTIPDVSKDLQQNTLARFAMQLIIPQTDILSVLNLNQGMIDPGYVESVTIILDIDLYREKEVPQTEHEIWDFFEVLHVRKNEAFESCLTDKTRSLFE